MIRRSGLGSTETFELVQFFISQDAQGNFLWATHLSFLMQKKDCSVSFSTYPFLTAKARGVTRGPTVSLAIHYHLNRILHGTLHQTLTKRRLSYTTPNCFKQWRRRKIHSRSHNKDLVAGNHITDFKIIGRSSSNMMNFGNLSQEQVGRSERHFAYEVMPHVCKSIPQKA